MRSICRPPLESYPQDPSLQIIVTGSDHFVPQDRNGLREFDHTRRALTGNAGKVFGKWHRLAMPRSCRTHGLAMTHDCTA